MLIMKSPNILNYEIRPCKFVERRILLASLYQIVINMRQAYQYIGFGGLAFTDFKLFHKELSIDSMYSIEGCFTPENWNLISLFLASRYCMDYRRICYKKLICQSQALYG